MLSVNDNCGLAALGCQLFYYILFTISALKQVGFQSIIIKDYYMQIGVLIFVT